MRRKFAKSNKLVEVFNLNQEIISALISLLKLQMVWEIKKDAQSSIVSLARNLPICWLSSSGTLQVYCAEAFVLGKQKEKEL
jgi:hypothetical protein